MEYKTGTWMGAGGGGGGGVTAAFLLNNENKFKSFAPYPF